MYEDIMTQHFPHLEKETGSHIQEALKVPNKMNLRKPTPICNTNKLSKVKGQTLKKQGKNNLLSTREPL